MNNRKRFAPILLLPAIFALPAMAQTITTGEITGTVTDSSGAVVVGASVRLKNSETGNTTDAPSNGSGVYRFIFVKPGSYEISAAVAGLRSDIGAVSAAVGRVQAIDLVVKRERSKQAVFVIDADPLLNSDNANIVYTLSTIQLELLPLPGGDLVSAAYAIPTAVTPRGQGCYGGSFASSGLGGVSNLFTIDGADDMDPYTNLNNSGATGLLLGANEVQQVSIVQNPVVT